MVHISDAQRRARLARRHALSPQTRLDSAEAVTRALTVLHATEAASVHLAVAARSDGVTIADVDQALYTERSLVKQLAMRRTLFVFPVDLLPATLAGPSARVAAIERARLITELQKAGLVPDGDRWMDEVRAAVLAHLRAVPEGASATRVREVVPATDIRVEPTGAWAASRVLTHLGLTGDVVRGRNEGHWRVSRPLWTATEHWLRPKPGPLESAAEGYRELVRRWLFSFGPGTTEDLQWWLGSTKTAARAALAAVGAEPVSLEHGATGWILPDDRAEVEEPGPWAALLPALDPTVMGWQERAFYLGPHRSAIFDSRGNGGQTAWLNGRIVGSWSQDEQAAVRLHLLEPVSAGEHRLLTAEAERLSAWVEGVRVSSIYTAPMVRTMAGPGSG